MNLTQNLVTVIMHLFFGLDMEELTSFLHCGLSCWVKLKDYR